MILSCSFDRRRLKEIGVRQTSVAVRFEVFDSQKSDISSDFVQDLYGTLQGLLVQQETLNVILEPVLVQRSFSGSFSAYVVGPSTDSVRLAARAQRQAAPLSSGVKVRRRNLPFRISSVGV